MGFGGTSVPGPTSAVVAVTLNCNARCVMCDIWRNDVSGEMRPEEYLALPSTLRDVNVSGGEPFLRDDLPRIVRAIREAAPRARLVISSHGFLVEKATRALREILAIDPRVGLRVSLDALGERHDAIRGVPGGFARARRTLDAARDLGVRDLGIAATILDENVDQLRPLHRFARENALELSVTVATDSPIYFGEGKASRRPTDRTALRAELGGLARREYRRLHPRGWVRGWFETRLLDYVLSGRRPLPCDAGRGFFYLDSRGTVYACNARDLRMGDLRATDWEVLWAGAAADAARTEAATCRRCWMVCTARSQMRRRLPSLAPGLIAEKLGAHLRRTPS